MRSLHRSAHFVLTVDDELRLVRRTRTDQPFESVTELELAYDAVVLALETVDRDRHVLLVDLRLAPARNDTPFEQVVARYTTRIYGGFRRIAVITRTEAGRLQVTRLTRGSSPGLRTFTEEPAAFSYLTEPEPPGRRQG